MEDDEDQIYNKIGPLHSVMDERANVALALNDNIGPHNCLSYEELEQLHRQWLQEPVDLAARAWYKANFALSQPWPLTRDLTQLICQDLSSRDAFSFLRVCRGFYRAGRELLERLAPSGCYFAASGLCLAIDTVFIRILAYSGAQPRAAERVASCSEL